MDNAGNRIKEDTFDPSGTLARTLSRVYNQLGQLQQSLTAKGHATTYAYDAAGNNVGVTDALGITTGQAYDPLGRLVQTLQDSAGIQASTRFAYDADDNLTAVTDPNGLTTHYTYDGFGDLTQLASPDTGVTQYGYDSAGNRISQTDARGMVAQYRYDALGRVTHTGYSDGSAPTHYTYDQPHASCPAGEQTATGLLTTMVSGSVATHYCHDRWGQWVRKIQTVDGLSLITRYTYDSHGRPSGMTYPDGTHVDYRRNGLGQISEVGYTPPGGPRQVIVTGIGYAPFGPAIGWTYDNGRTLTRPLTQDYRPRAVHDPQPGGLSYAYGYDAVGNLGALKDAQHTSDLGTYVYDRLHRLTQHQDGAGRQARFTYHYDATGNRTRVQVPLGNWDYGYATGSHRLTSVAGNARSYDAAGNTLGGIGGRRYDYGADGRMQQVVMDGAELARYRYNGKGEQVTRVADSDVSHFIHDEAGQWLGEYDAQGQPTQQVIWLDSDPIAVITGHGSTRQLGYIQPDPLGTPRVIIDSERNNAIWHWPLTGEAFGNTPPDTDPDADGVAFTFNLRFPGQRYDPYSGLNYNYFRDYEPATGRYVQSDPIGLKGGVSTYGYVLATPLIATDPKGLQTTADTWCRQHPVECAAIFGTGAAITVVPKPQTITLPKTSSGEKCKTCAEVYPEYDECSEMGAYYPYASVGHALLDFPAGNKKRPGQPATSGLCAMKGMHHTVFVGSAYVGSIFSCKCCTNTGGGPVIEEIWGNNRGR